MLCFLAFVFFIIAFKAFECMYRYLETIESLSYVVTFSEP